MPIRDPGSALVANRITRSILMSFGLLPATDGTPKFFGDGNAKAVITGDVVNKDGNRIGDLYEIGTKAVRAWETLLNEWNVNCGGLRT